MLTVDLDTINIVDSSNHLMYFFTPNFEQMFLKVEFQHRKFLSGVLLLIHSQSFLGLTEYCYCVYILIRNKT